MLSLPRAVDVVFEIDLGAIQENFQTISALVEPHVSVAAVVKSDAYGLGLVEIARALIDAGCDLLFVANLHEALILRSSHIEQAVAVFCDEFTRFGQCYRSKGLIPVINNGAELEAINATARQAYFLNVETGLSRLGLAFVDVRRAYLSGTFDRYSPLVVLSHLACSERVADATNVVQRNRFQKIYDLLRPTRGSLAASAGVWLGKSYHFDMVRVGSALYGLNSAGIQPSPLQPVVRLRAKILDVRNVARGEAVGYGATFRTVRTSRIAIVGIGYKHGLPWACANKISVRFAGHSAPLIGRISMEYITIDITDVPEALCVPGSFVELLGKDFTVEDLASAAGGKPQELLTRLGAGCTRRYLTSSFQMRGP
ncbi:MAG: alanine racemase [Mesorhizobium sp.]|uniref:alanine racemase n=1 Tax=Mesorhizobium sp. TaxID=1871066 RepID=UPI000FE6F92D|nr:alanine racemase [Mesorhizobium sp.]RWH49854.1 MAG: alanine racemase [Mesorhizobium sp.]TIP38974.1 MAG: alanine racemase [Mesorhizobium sp.]TIW46410.1 MAG: alanine racemase [Mesorhizobium sp.]